MMMTAKTMKKTTCAISFIRSIVPFIHLGAVNSLEGRVKKSRIKQKKQEITNTKREPQTSNPE